MILVQPASIIRKRRHFVFPRFALHVPCFKYFTDLFKARKIKEEFLTNCLGAVFTLSSQSIYFPGMMNKMGCVESKILITTQPRGLKTINLSI